MTIYITETAVEIGDGGQGSKQESSADTLSADIDNQKGEVVPCSEGNCIIN